jgi:hypothetical protein
VPAGRLLVLTGDANPASLSRHGQFYSLRYSADHKVTVGFVLPPGRTTGTPSAVFAATDTFFADARVFTAPRGAPFGQQSISLFNPGAAATTVTVTLLFDHHDPVEVTTLILGVGASRHLKLTEFTSLIAQRLGGLHNLPSHAYSLAIHSDSPIVAQTSQLDSDGRAELGMTLGAWTPPS